MIIERMCNRLKQFRRVRPDLTKPENPSPHFLFGPPQKFGRLT